MSLKLGHCITGHHSDCPGRVNGSPPYPDLNCSCDCHQKESDDG